jgi:hypothetical protein
MASSGSRDSDQRSEEDYEAGQEALECPVWDEGMSSAMIPPHHVEPDHSAARFFILKDGVETGPFDKADLLCAGLRWDTPVRAQNTSDWRPAWKVQELEDLFPEIHLRQHALSQRSHFENQPKTHDEEVPIEHRRPLEPKKIPYSEQHVRRLGALASRWRRS